MRLRWPSGKTEFNIHHCNVVYSFPFPNSISRLSSSSSFSKAKPKKTRKHKFEIEYALPRVLELGSAGRGSKPSTYHHYPESITTQVEIKGKTFGCPSSIQEQRAAGHPFIVLLLRSIRGNRQRLNREKLLKNFRGHAFKPFSVRIIYPKFAQHSGGSHFCTRSLNRIVGETMKA